MPCSGCSPLHEANPIEKQNNKKQVLQLVVNLGF